MAETRQAPPIVYHHTGSSALSDEQAIEEKKNDAFLKAVEDNEVALVKEKLAAGQSPNVGTEDRKSAVHLAMKLPTTEILDMLIKADAWLDFEDKEGKRPIHEGIEGSASQEPHLKLLLAQSDKDGKRLVDINPTSMNPKRAGNTLVHTAAWYNNGAALNLLLDTNEFTDLEKRNDEGKTALHIAAFRCGEKECKKLVDKGANPNAQEKNGRRLSKETPGEMAMSLGRDNNAKYLNSVANVASVSLNINKFKKKMVEKADGGEAQAAA